MRRLSGMRAMSAAVFGCALAAVAATAPTIPTPVRAGSFEGTWSRREPGWRQALQFRRGAGGKSWDVRFYWQTAEGFDVDTQWQPRYAFRFKGFDGTLEVAVDRARSTDDRLVVHYRRDQDGPEGRHRTETGDANVYRWGAEGRTLVWIQDPLTTLDKNPTTALTPDDEKGVESKNLRLWNFNFITFRMIQWDEVPW